MHFTQLYIPREYFKLEKQYMPADVIFWLCLIFFLDPGGYLKENIRYVIPNLLTYRDTLFIIAWSTMLVVNINAFFHSLRNKFIRNYFIFALIWLSYYIIVFGYLKSQEDISLVEFMKERRIMIIRFFWVFPAYIFIKRTPLLFIKLYVGSTIIILVLNILTILTGIHLAPVIETSRYFTESTRYILRGFGLMIFTIYLSIISFFIKLRNRTRILIYTSGILMVTMIILSLTRRGLIEIVIAMFLGFFVVKRAMKMGKLLVLRKILVPTVFIIILVGLIFPSYIPATFSAIKETFIIVQTGKTSQGQTDYRVNPFANQNIIRTFLASPAFGTGYKTDWYTGAGGQEKLEGADYILLANLAMFGLVGVGLFLYFYIWIIRIIRHLFNTTEDNYLMLLGNLNTIWPVLILPLSITTLIFFHFIEYPNYFYPISVVNDGSKYFIYAGFMVGCIETLDRFIATGNILNQAEKDH
jgi:hypothetical protein